MAAGYPATVWVLIALSLSSAHAQLTDRAAELGLDTLGVKEGGLCWGFLDDDEWIDLVVRTNPDTHVFANEGGTRFTDVTATRAPTLTQAGDLGRACAIADFDHDGNNDLVLTTGTTVRVYLNRGSPGFELGPDGPDFVVDATAIPMMDSEGLAVLDYDRDGWLDIAFQALAGVRIVHNDAGAGFSLPMGARAMALAGPATGTGDYLTAADFNLDGLVDLAARLSDAPDLYANTGTNFAAVAMPDFAALATDDGAIVFCDFDNDQDFDWFWSDGPVMTEGVNRIYTQDAPGVFALTGEPAIAFTNIEGVACADFDNDGDLELYVGTSTVDSIFRNESTAAGLAFTEQMLEIGMNDGEGADVADFDNDGDVDLLINETSRMDPDPSIHNVVGVNGTNSPNYLMVRVLAEVGSCPSVLRDDLGAVVAVRASDDSWNGPISEVSGGRGHGQQPSPVLHFGVPDPSAEYVVDVRFVHPGGERVEVRVRPAALGTYHLLRAVTNDPDGDGIRSTEEGDADPDADGIAASFDVDSDGDGLLDGAEAGDLDPCTPPADGDADGTPDYLEPSEMPRLDGGAPALDGGSTPFDAGVSGPVFQAHGSGCIRCSAPALDGRDAIFVAALAWLVRRRIGTRR